MAGGASAGLIIIIHLLTLVEEIHTARHDSAHIVVDYVESLVFGNAAVDRRRCNHLQRFFFMASIYIISVFDRKSNVNRRSIAI